MRGGVFASIVRCMLYLGATFVLVVVTIALAYYTWRIL